MPEALPLFAVGNDVEAQDSSDLRWHRGRVKEVLLDPGMYVVAWHFPRVGDQPTHAGAMRLLKDVVEFQSGQRCEAQFAEDARWYEAIIQEADLEQRRYFVRFLGEFFCVACLIVV